VVVIDVHLESNPLRSLGSQVLACLPERGAPDPAASQRRLHHEPVDGSTPLVPPEPDRPDRRAIQLDDRGPLTRRVQALGEIIRRTPTETQLEKASDQRNVGRRSLAQDDRLLARPARRLAGQHQGVL
jgi:hypothetical protein